MNAPQNLPQADTPPKLPTIQAGAAVRAIVPNDFDSAWRIANAVVKSGMAPRGVDTPEKAMVAIMHGLEVGMTPMMALQSIAPINGRPAIYGDGALGLVQGSGLLEWHKEYYKGEPDTDAYTAVCEVKRKGDPEIKIGEFSIKDAKDAQLYGKDGPWKQYRKRMLKMRARSFALRDGFSDVLRGLNIAEEAQDIPLRDVTPRDAGPPAPPPRTAIEHKPLVREVDPAPRAEPEVEIIDEQTASTAPTDDQGIPEFLRREAPSFDEAQWLRDLEGALSGCEDFASVGEVQRDVMMPEKKQASPTGWKKAEKLVAAALDRINTALAAG